MVERARGRANRLQKPGLPRRCDPGATARPPPSKAPKLNDTQNSLLVELKSIASRFSPEATQERADAKFRENKALMRNAMRMTCRICLKAGRGVLQHSGQERKKAGNPCSLNCKNCTTPGNPARHWADDCPKKSQ